MSLPSDVTVDNLKDFYAMILPYLNVGNGGTSDTPLGQVAFFDDVVAPAGWLIADGTVYNIADYPDLATQYERVHGSKNFYGGNGTTTFAVPDLQGEFLRASGTNSHANQGSGAAVGVHQDGTEHVNIGAHADKNTNWNNVSYTDSRLKAGKKDSDIGTESNNIAWSGSGGTATLNYSEYPFYTSRPTNTSLLLCIKAVPSSEMNTYSTTERRVGTWIDGKPLYEKIISFNASSASSLVIATLSSIDNMISLEGWIKDNAGVYNINNFNCRLNYNYGNGQLKWEAVSGGSWSNISGYAIVQYTKTTDV